MATIYTPGFDGDIMVATNVDFALPTGTAQKMITVGGQIMIGTGNVYPLQEIAAGFITAGPGISIAYTGGNVEITNIVPPSPLIITPDTGVNIVNTIFNFNGFGGLETFGFSATDLQIQNKRWLSAFVVDPSIVFGQEGEYTTIQAAITAATAPAVVYVRCNAANYVENLTFKAGVDVIGVDADGKGNSSGVIIEGNHTYSGDGTTFIENLTLLATVGDALTIAPAGTDASNFVIKDCLIQSNAGRGVFLNPGVTATSLFTSNESEITSQNQCMDFAGASVAVGYQSIFLSSASDVVRLAGNQSFLFYGCQLSASSQTISFAGANGAGICNYCRLSSSSLEIVDFAVSGGNYRGSNNIMSCSAPSGFYIIGTGTYTYSDETIKGTATAIDPTVTQSIDVWRPHSQAGAAPGTGVARGTAAFDIAQFTVTDGFVQLAAGASGITTLDADDATSTTGTTILLQGIAGIETGNAGAGVIEISNKRFLTPYVVDPSALFGTRGEYTTIQAAINAAFADGGGTVYIRQGTYTEDLTLQPSVDLMGIPVDGRTSFFGATNLVSIVGSHTLASAGTVGISSIDFSSTTADTLTVSNAVGTAFVGIKYCSLNAAGGFSAVAMNVPMGAVAQVAVENSNLFSASDTVTTSGLGNCEFITLNSNVISTASSAVSLAASSLNSSITSSTVNGSVSAISIGNSAVTLVLESNKFVSGIGVDFVAAGTVISLHNSWRCSVGSDYIVGFGNYVYADDLLLGTPNAIDVATTQTKLRWRGRAEAGVIGVAYEGVASFDATNFTVTDGFVQLIGGGSGITTLDANDTSSTTGSTILLNGIAGIETGNAGAGTIDISNKRFISPYVVDPSAAFGTRGEYTTVQAAINAAALAGGGTVYIRQGTYVENLAFAAGVDLIGLQVDGRLPTFLGKVVIQGNHTFNVVAGFAFVVMDNISLECLVGDLLTINTTGGSSAIVACKFSGFTANTDPASRTVVLNPAAASSCQFSTDNTNIQSASHCFENIGLGSGSAFLSLGNANSSTGSIMHNSGGGSVSISGQWTAVSANQPVMNSVIGSGSSTFTHSEINISNEAFLLGVGLGSVNVSHCSIGSGAASGNWIDGPAGVAVTFGDILLTNTAQNIGAAVLQNKVNWQPYGESGVLASAYRGTAAFSSTDFTVTDGFVELTALAAGITTLTANDATSTTGTNITLNGIAGIETGNAGAGTIDISNKRFVSPYVVDPSAVFGTRGEYTTVQAAINAAFAAGGGVVYVRPGVYTENLTLEPGVSLIGLDADGRVPSVFSKIQIIGNHVMSSTGVFLIESILFTNVAGDVFTINNAVSVSAILIKFCRIDSAAIAFVMNSGIGAACQIEIDTCNIFAINQGVDMFGTSEVGCTQSLVNSSNDESIRINGAGTVNSTDSRFSSATNTFLTADPGAQVNLEFCRAEAGFSIIQFGVSGASANARHCTFTAGNVSTYYVEGTGTFDYANIININAVVSNVDPLVTQFKRNWQPYGESGVLATAYRGTAAFDSTQFTVTDGFVQNLNGLGITSIDVDAFLFPGTDPVLPDVAGLLGIFATNLATNGIPIQTRSIAANTFQIELQRAGAASSSTVSLNGTCHFNDTQFSIDTDGFVEILGTASANSFPTDSGTAAPLAGVVNILGGPGVTTSAAGNTVTINSVIFTDQGASITVTKNSGTYSTGAGSLVFTLPVTAGLVNGDLCAFCLAGSTDITVTANAGQTIQWGTSVTGVAGSINTAQDGSFIVFRFRVASQRWYAESIVGNWT